MMQSEPEFIDWLKQKQPAFAAGFIASAPGRLDLMGGIADYSGSLVLETPITDRAYVAIAWQDQPTVSLTSVCPTSGETRKVQLDLDCFNSLVASNWEGVRTYFDSLGDDQWTAYPAGTMLALLRDVKQALPRGLSLLLRSDVPEGKGVSSSAAIEVATMRAFSQAMQIDVDDERIALLCQQAENHAAGAPCGIMDQMTSSCGTPGPPGSLLSLLCQPAEIQGLIPLPDAITIWGIDSGIRHAVGGSDYGVVRTGAFMGYRIIAAQAGLPAERIDDGKVRVDDQLWSGYLANITPGEFESRFADKLPDQMAGKDFLDTFAGITDHVTHVDPVKTYAVKQPTAHPIYEHGRVTEFEKLIRSPITTDTLEQMGELMYASHASYSACGLGSEGTDALVNLAKAAGTKAGIYGAKITGGGSGGTVAILGDHNAESSVRAIAKQYSQAHDKPMRLFVVS